MTQDETGMVVVLIDTQARLEQMHRAYPALAERFQYIGCENQKDDAAKLAQAREEELKRQQAQQEAEAARKRQAEREAEIRRQAEKEAEEKRRQQEAAARREEEERAKAEAQALAAKEAEEARKARKIAVWQSSREKNCAVRKRQDAMASQSMKTKKITTRRTSMSRRMIMRVAAIVMIIRTITKTAIKTNARTTSIPIIQRMSRKRNRPKSPAIWMLRSLFSMPANMHRRSTAVFQERACWLCTSALR